VVRDLTGTAAVRENVLKELPADMFYGVGHGYNDAFLGWRNTDIFTTCDCKELAGSLVYLLSCLTANELGKDIIKKGGRAYIGYTVEFTIVVEDFNACESDPYSEKYCKWFFIPVRELLERIADGETMDYAQSYSITKWSEAIDYWTANPENNPYAGMVVYYLQWDRDHQVLYGDPNARLAPGFGLRATTEAGYEESAKIYDMVITPSVSAEYEDTATLSVKKRNFWIYYIPAIASAIYAFTQKDEDKRRKGLILVGALGLGAFAYLQLTKPKPRPYIPTGVQVTASAVAEYFEKATALPPVVLKPSITSDYVELTTIVRAIKVEASAIAGYDETATATPAVRVDASDSLDSTAEAKIGLPPVLRASATASYVESATLSVLKVVAPLITASYVESVTIVRAINVRPGTSADYVDTATVGISITIQVADSLDSSTQARIATGMLVQASATASYTDTATVSRKINITASATASYVESVAISVSRGLVALVTASYSETATVGGIFNVSASDSLDSSTQASVTTGGGLTVFGFDSLVASLDPFPFFIYEGVTTDGVLYTNIDCSKLVSVTVVDAYATYACVDGKVVVYTYDKNVSGEVWSLQPDGTITHSHTPVPKNTTVRVAYIA